MALKHIMSHTAGIMSETNNPWELCPINFSNHLIELLVYASTKERFSCQI